MNKILVFGLGSIGIRHVQVLREFGKFEIAAYRTKKGMKKIQKDLERRIKYFYDEDEAFAWNPDFMIVSNPTNLHLEYLLKSISHNIDALIEKPVANDYNEIKLVEDKIKKRNNKIYVGFNLRFHPIVKKVKEIIDTREYGEVLKANLYVGEYLPFWHPYEDYTKSYAARKELGGGVLRTLSHEIDLGQYWFGNYERIFAKVCKISDLDIDVDDSTDIFAEMKGGMILKISMDYLNPLSEREGELFFVNGLLKYNFLNMKVEFTDYANKETKTLLKIDNYDYNAQYKCQIEKFINRSNEEICSIEEGINVLKIINKCEESNQTGRMSHV
jgi:predicted dehydrogenase